MAFKQFNLSRVDRQTRGTYNIYTYQTDDRSLETQFNGYFEESRFRTQDGPDTNSDGWIGGFIFVKAIDGLYIGIVQEDGVTVNAVDLGDISNIGGEVTTTDNIWTEVLRIPLFSGSEFRLNMNISAIRSDDDGAWTRQYQGIIANYAGADEDLDTIFTSHVDGSFLRTRTSTSGNDVVFEVRGRTGQTWDWIARGIFSDID